MKNRRLEKIARILEVAGYNRVVLQDWDNDRLVLRKTGSDTYIELKIQTGPKLNMRNVPYTPTRGNSGGWE